MAGELVPDAALPIGGRGAMATRYRRRAALAQLSGSGKAGFRTRGRYSSTAVRDTTSVTGAAAATPRPRRGAVADVALARPVVVTAANDYPAGAHRQSPRAP